MCVHNSTHTATHVHVCAHHHSVPPIYIVSPPVLLEFRAGVLRLPMKWGDNEPLTPFATRCAPVRGFFPRISLRYAYRTPDVSLLFRFLSAGSSAPAFRSTTIFREFLSFFLIDTQFSLSFWSFSSRTLSTVSVLRRVRRQNYFSNSITLVTC